MKDPSSRLTSLTDVAERAGVSVATASRVLSTSTYPVAEETRRKVQEAAQELDFAPNLMARGLVAQRTYQIGLVVNDLEDERSAAIARGVEDAATENGFSVLVMSTDADPEREIAAVRRMRSLRVDAIVFSYSINAGQDHYAELTSQLRHVEAGGGALVRLAPHPRVNPDASVSLHRGLELVVDHLSGLGHQRIALVTSAAGTGASQVAVYGMRRAMETHGHAFPERLVVRTDGTRANARSAVAGLLAQRSPCTAIVATSDHLALGVLRGLSDAGVDVPTQMSVTGFDDVPSAVYMSPSLTTVHVPLRDLGAAGVQVAIWLLGGGARRGRNNLPVELVVRESTGPAPERRSKRARASRQSEPAGKRSGGSS